jgi:restriction system protein
MPIPDFQSLMRPLLQMHADGLEHVNRDLVSQLAEHFHLTEDERREMLPSGTTRVLDNRIGWAKSHITQGGLLASPRRAVTVITQRGHDVLKKNPGRVDLRVLNEFEDYQAHVRSWNRRHHRLDLSSEKNRLRLLHRHLSTSGMAGV